MENDATPSTDPITMDLTGKVALVTGGSRGIGKQIAITFARAGAQVMIASRKAEALETAAAEIDEASGSHGCAWLVGNTGQPDTARELVQGTIERLGAIDILVNNAATNPYAGPMIEVDLGRWEKTIAVNLTGPLLLTQAAWQEWMKEHGGVVINISSVGGLMTSEVLGVYDLTKSAMIHMTQQLGAELGPQVRVNAICPGLIKTDFARMLWEGEAGDRVAQTYPMKRLGETWDIANAALFLAAETGSWMTGQHIVLDGGGLVAFKKPG